MKYSIFLLVVAALPSIAFTMEGDNLIERLPTDCLVRIIQFVIQKPSNLNDGDYRDKSYGKDRDETYRNFLATFNFGVNNDPHYSTVIHMDTPLCVLKPSTIHPSGWGIQQKRSFTSVDNISKGLKQLPPVSTKFNEIIMKYFYINEETKSFLDIHQQYIFKSMLGTLFLPDQRLKVDDFDIKARLSLIILNKKLLVILRIEELNKKILSNSFDTKDCAAFFSHAYAINDTDKARWHSLLEFLEFQFNMSGLNGEDKAYSPYSGGYILSCGFYCVLEWFKIKYLKELLDLTGNLNRLHPCLLVAKLPENAADENISLSNLFSILFRKLLCLDGLEGNDSLDEEQVPLENVLLESPRRRRALDRG